MPSFFLANVASFLASVLASIYCNFTNGCCNLGAYMTGFERLVLIDDATWPSLPKSTGSEIYGCSSVRSSILALRVPSDSPLSDGTTFDCGDGVFLRHPDCLFTFFGLTSTQKESG